LLKCSIVSIYSYIHENAYTCSFTSFLQFASLKATWSVYSSRRPAPTFCQGFGIHLFCESTSACKYTCAWGNPLLHRFLVRMSTKTTKMNAKKNIHVKLLLVTQIAKKTWMSRCMYSHVCMSKLTQCNIYATLTLNLQTYYTETMRANLLPPCCLTAILPLSLQHPLTRNVPAIPNRMLWLRGNCWDCSSSTP
jgi:hypothetical protein